MSVYILHLNTPLGHARHYVGWAKKVNKRFEHHKNGCGARFTQVCVERGIDFVLARVFEGADKSFERKLKNTNNTKDYCPICMGDHVREYKPCLHDRKVGDNYGISCQDCGAQLEGYGYWGRHKKCIHRFANIYGNEQRACMYCEMPENLIP